ncbi:MAG: ATP synthase subunit I [Lachnospiraceae bacterium]|nr:ATP synthase subunit I [Lachnospiraceae bacterium]
MKQIKETMTGFLIGITVYALLVEIVGIFFSDNILSYTLGLLFGIAVAVALIFHMAYTLDNALDMPEAQAVKYTRRQSFLRLAIMLCAMIAALIVQKFNFITVILGMLGLKIGALIAPFFLKRLYPDSFVTKEELPESEDEARDIEKGSE